MPQIASAGSASEGAERPIASRDIAGIVLNRWGHAYVNAGPGFYFGRNGKPAPRDVLREARRTAEQVARMT